MKIIYILFCLVTVAKLSANTFASDVILDRVNINTWYVYQGFPSHKLLSKQDVYKLKLDSVSVKLQIIDFYDELDEPGLYSLRIQRIGKDQTIYTHKVKVDLCKGNPVACLTKNLLRDEKVTFFNIKSGKHISVSEKKVGNFEWHIAFLGSRGNKIMINKSAGVEIFPLYRQPSLIDHDSFDEGEITTETLNLETWKIFKTHDFFMDAFKEIKIN